MLPLSKERAFFYSAKSELAKLAKTVLLTEEEPRVPGQEIDKLHNIRITVAVIIHYFLSHLPFK